MLRRDYFLRSIQEMAQVLARLLFRKNEEQYAEGLSEADQALQALTNKHLAEIEHLPFQDVLALFPAEAGPGRSPRLLLADILREVGDLHALESRPLTAAAFYAHAVGLYLDTLMGGQGMVSVEDLEKLDELLQLTREQGTILSPEVLRRRFFYYEQRNSWGLAEDALFEWLQSGDRAAVEEGPAFYERMAAKDDEELTRGDFSRGEIEEGKQAFHRAAGQQNP